MSAGRNTSAPSLYYYPCVFSSFLGYSLLSSALIDRSRVHLDRFLHGPNQLEFGHHILKLQGSQSRWRQNVASGRTDRQT
jgi:hypothetical protein